MAVQSLKPIRFGDYLVERQAITEQQLLDALADHWQNNCRVGDSLVARRYLDRDDVERLYAEFSSLNTIYV